MSLIGRWFRGEPLPGDRDFFLYERVKRGITNDQQSREVVSDVLNRRDVMKEALKRSERPRR